MCPAVRLYLTKLSLCAVPLAGFACGGEGGTDVVLPALSITTSTTGVELDPDGYNVAIDGQPVGSIGVQATLAISQLAAGQHTVELSGVAPNCVVGGENPRVVEIADGATASVVFTIECAAGTGGIRIATITGGTGSDPDGFTLLLDGGERGPIGPTATSILSGVPAGSHTVGLAGVAVNCQVAGDNPRPVSVTAGQTSEVSFEVSCTAPAPATGTLEISVSTTGPNPDPDGYQLSVDGGASQPIGSNATVTLANVTAAEHVVQLLGLASNCAVSGDNPVGAAVPAGGTARISFAVSCAATVGQLTVTISGLPAGAQAAVTVSGPGNFSRGISVTTTLSGLVPGTYAIAGSNVVSGGTTYTPSIARPTVDVVAGATAAAAVSYTGEAPVTLNLRIDGLYITQSAQTYGSTVPLVAGRDAFLRVFVIANENNSARPRVQVRLLPSNRTFNIEAPGNSTPTQVQEGVLNSSWNVRIPGSLIQSGLSVVAEVDPNSSIAESNETDNRFPATGSRALTVTGVPPARIRFVSVQQGSGPPGNVSDANKDQLMQLARRLHPLNAVDVDVHSMVFTASAPLQPGPAGDGWGQLVSDLDGARVAEGSDRTYFGIVKLTYGRSDGLVGVAFQERPTAVGWDDPGDASRVVAHELGHTWGRRHTNCGGPPAGTTDPLYPYSGGQIGVSGFDVANGVLKPASSPDIMGYCFQSPWISDYTYQGIMSFRGSAAAGVRLAGVPQPSLLIWGRVVNGRPVLEPAFEIVTRPHLPRLPGPYSVSATGVDGSRLFTLSFDVAEVEDNPAASGHFAFAVPLDPAHALRLGSLRLDGPTGSVSSSPLAAQIRTGLTGGSIVARREGENVSLRWDASIHQTIMVRDADTGEVLSFARGGTALVRTRKNELDLNVSDGVRSQRVRLAISRS